MTAKAIRELASIFQPEGNLSAGENPLLIAAGAVGKSLGITIRSPDFSENSITIQEIARASGFRTRQVNLTPNWWQTDCGPLLGFIKGGNVPIALLPGKKNEYEMLEPKELKRIPVNRLIADRLAPVAYTFYRPLPDKKITVLDILRFILRGQTRSLLKIMWLGIAAAFLGMFAPFITGILVDFAIPDAKRNLLLQMGSGLFAASLGVTIFQIAQSFAILRLQTRIGHDIQAAVWDRLLKLKPAFFREFSTGDLYDRISAVTQIRNRLSGSVLRILFASLFALLNLGLLLFYSPFLTLVAIIVALVVVFVTSISSLFVRRKMRPLQQLAAEIFGFTVQLIGGVSKLRVAAAESEAFACWAKKYTEQVKLMLSTQLLEDLLAVFNVIIPTIASILLFGLAVYSIEQSSSELSTGKFLAFNAAFATFIIGATQLSNTLINILDINILWERAQPILQTIPEVDANKFHPGKLSGQLKLAGVKFRYRRDSPLILDNIDLEVRSGEFIAFVGPSGSGKSTIIRLLLGFETPEAGTIFYDGKNLSTLDLAAVRRQLGVVLQNGRIASGSIWENIAGAAIVTRDEAWLALEMAGLADEVRAMPMGIQTIVSEGGGNLSGGQRQRLSIARALVRQPRILLFDEATSALDNQTQAIVTRSLENLGVTRIIIAHRLSTIRHADRICVLQNGKIVQQGTFEELSAVKGLFADLMARQLT